MNDPSQSRLIQTWHWLNNTPPKSLFDRQLIWLSFALMMIGLVMVTSASFPVSERLVDFPFHFMIRHAIFLVISLGAATVVLFIPMKLWLRYSSYFLGLSLLMLLFVAFAGKSVNGASRWIPLGPFNLQPAEVAKLSLFIFIAGYLERWKGAIQSSFFDGYIKPLIVLGIMGLLLLLQPDFGSLVVMLVTVFGMLFIAGAKLQHFLGIVAAGIVVVIGLIASAPYRIRRVTSFLDPWADRFGDGYQLTQSLMAFGRGEFMGEGLGNSIQKLEYLPEAHTDFVFAVLAEELGFVGVIFVLVLILWLVLKAVSIGKAARELDLLFQSHLAMGIAIWFAFQTFVNIGAASGMMPTKGLTLPLISYGGSSLVIMFVAVSILLRIDHEVRLLRENQNEEE
ncbi:cell division protein FtsW [Vibrio sp.]|nr:cell division protein FtsW [Vibrio sp.]